MCNILLDVSKFQLFSASRSSPCTTFRWYCCLLHRCCIWAVDSWLAHWSICELFIYIWDMTSRLHSTTIFNSPQDWTSAFYLLMSCCFLSAMVSTRISSWSKPCNVSGSVSKYQKQACSELYWEIHTVILIALVMWAYPRYRHIIT